MKKRSAWILTLFLLVANAQAQQTITSGVLVPENATSLEIRSVFDPLPPSGYAPLRIIASNSSEADSRWDFAFHSKVDHFRMENSHRSRFQMLVPARGTQSASYLVPLVVNYGGSSSWSENHQLLIAVDATGVGHRDFHKYGQRSDDFPAIAISKRLAEVNHTRLKDEVEQRAKSSGARGGLAKIFGSEFNPHDLPEDWRGLSGFDVLMISDAEWQSIKSGQRLAILQWARLGGQIDFYAISPTTAKALGLPVDNAGKLSLGEVHFRTWDGKNLDAETVVGRLWGRAKRVKALTNDYTGQTGVAPAKKPDWAVLDSLGLRRFASWQVIVFLVIFGILVGPANLFLLAPTGKRHRLFVTTPLLSIGASVIMLIIILFQDGIGGLGSRFVLINLEPEEAAAYVTQEQASRTGVLFGAGFEMKQPVLIEPLALPDSPWVKLKNTMTSQGVTLSQDDRLRSGNYFQSRAEQGQILRAVVPTRARLEVKPAASTGAAPQLISALGFTLSELFYIDAEGGVWHGDKTLASGQQVPLQKSDEPTLRKTWKAFVSLSQGQNRRCFEAPGLGQLPKNSFFGRVSEAPEMTLQTLPSIRWNSDIIAVFGRVTTP
ncbi:MAG: hypothetical protein RL015_2510 [Verrucomicrobiota bacterium]|jgi:hypothetical protein